MLKAFVNEVYQKWNPDYPSGFLTSSESHRGAQARGAARHRNMKAVKAQRVSVRTEEAGRLKL